MGSVWQKAIHIAYCCSACPAGLVCVVRPWTGFTSYQEVSKETSWSYLTARELMQSVKISDITSQALTLHCGDSQGLVLGPTLFTVYTANEIG